MDGKNANLVLTDPPYGVSFKASDGLTIKNDSLKGEEFYKFLLAAFKNMIKIDGETVCNYDRGWDIHPTCKEAEMALCILLENHN